MKITHKASNINTKDNCDTSIMGWKYDFVSLPYWECRDKNPYCYDKYFEFTNSDVLCTIYSIEEKRMMAYYGYLAIFKNKKAPELLVNITEFALYDQDVFSDSSENFLFFRFEFLKKIIGSQFPVIIVDIKNEKFCLLKNKDTSRKYTVTEIDNDTFKISCLEENIKLSSQKWYNLHEIYSLSNHI